MRAVDSPKQNPAFLTLEEDDKGAYVLNSKDLNMLAYLQEMEGAGICSFKIEGRMKSGYYLATVINAYRMAMDGKPLSLCEEELLNVAHREYTTAYALGKNNQTVNYDDSQSKGNYLYVADVLGSEDGFVTLQMRNRFKKGDVLEVLSPDSAFGKTFVVDEMQGENGENVDDAKLVQAIYKVKCPYQLHLGDYVRRKIEG